MSLLLTGGTGFVGNEVRQQLASLGEPVLLLTRPGSKVQTKDNETPVEYDIELGGELPSLLTTATSVLHLAWSHLDDFTDEIHQTEVCRTHFSFIQKLLKLGIKRFTIAGTCAEYGKQTGELSESQVCEPTLNYAKGKLWLLQQLLQLKKSEPFLLNWARIFYVYGLNPRRTTIFNLIHKAALAGKRDFELRTGEQELDFLPVSTLAQNLLVMANQNQEFGVVNLCSGEPQKVKQVAEAFVQEEGHEIQLINSANPPGFAKPTWGCADKLNRILSEG